MLEFDLNFYAGKRVLVTGHTGFKGSWLCRLLCRAGAEVTGYSLNPPTEPSLFRLAGMEGEVTSIVGDIRDFPALRAAFDRCDPDIVFHLAAQPIVRDGYADPAYTYETNVMGTVNILECLRQNKRRRSFLNVTTDKVYRPRESSRGYREEDELDGCDPYSNSKSCSELVTHSYARSFFSDAETAVSAARAGNVIGGGDFASHRIIPDCVRAAVQGEQILVRNPHSVRPYQHVLESVYAYMMIAAKQYEDPARYAGWYNVGPDDRDGVRTGELAELFVRRWGEGVRWQTVPCAGPHETEFLRLDCSKLKSVFGWQPRWDLDRAVEMVVQWSKCWRSGGDVAACMDRQIDEFLMGR